MLGLAEAYLERTKLVGESIFKQSLECHRYAVSHFAVACNNPRVENMSFRRFLSWNALGLFWPFAKPGPR